MVCKKLHCAVLFFVLSTIFFTNTAFSQKIYKIGYIEGGTYWIFDKTMEAINRSVNNSDLPGKLLFLENAKFSPGWDNLDKLDDNANNLMKRDDLDLIISAGTDATRSILKANNFKTPIVAMGVSDALGSGFVKNKNKSGINNFTVRIVPERFERMFKIFHEVVGFKKLGLIYPDTKSGRKYTNLEAAKNVSRVLGFEIVEYKLKNEDTSGCLNGLKELRKKGMDAFFIPSLLCFDWDKSDVASLLNYLKENNIPTFARNGSKYVRAGALIGFSTLDFSKRGDFLSDKIIRILKGVKPLDLNMIDNAAPKISFNLQVAAEIGFDPPFDILAATDELYNEIISKP